MPRSSCILDCDLKCERTHQSPTEQASRQTWHLVSAASLPHSTTCGITFAHTTLPWRTPSHNCTGACDLGMVLHPLPVLCFPPLGGHRSECGHAHGSASNKGECLSSCRVQALDTCQVSPGVVHKVLLSAIARNRFPSGRHHSVFITLFWAEVTCIRRNIFIHQVWHFPLVTNVSSHVSCFHVSCLACFDPCQSMCVRSSWAPLQGTGSTCIPSNQDYMIRWPVQQAPHEFSSFGTISFCKSPLLFFRNWSWDWSFEPRFA